MSSPECQYDEIERMLDSVGFSWNVLLTCHDDDVGVRDAQPLDDVIEAKDVGDVAVVEPEPAKCEK